MDCVLKRGRKTPYARFSRDEFLAYYTKIFAGGEVDTKKTPHHCGVFKVMKIKTKIVHPAECRDKFTKNSRACQAKIFTRGNSRSRPHAKAAVNQPQLKSWCWRQRGVINPSLITCPRNFINPRAFVKQNPPVR